MPAPAVRPHDMDTVPLRRPAPAALIACGSLSGRTPGTPPAAPGLPCFQALGPWGEPDACLPWFRIGATDDLSSSATLAELLHRTAWLLLVIGNDHDALASALAIATIARGRGIHVIALLPGEGALADFQRRAVAQRVDYACECPPGADRLLAARALWSGIRPLADAGADTAALKAALAGALPDGLVVVSA